MTKPTFPFRIHFSDGTSTERRATSADAAREAVKDEAASRGLLLRKVKRIKGGHDGR